MLREDYFAGQGRDILHTQRAGIPGRCDAGDTVPAFIAGNQGREVGVRVFCAPHAGQATDHENFCKIAAAVDEVGDAFRGVELGKVHFILLHRLHEFHFNEVQVVSLRACGLNLHIPVSGILAVQQALPERCFMLAANRENAAVQAIHITVSPLPAGALLQHIKTGLPQLPRCRDELGVGIFAVLNEDKGETHEVRYSA